MQDGAQAKAAAAEAAAAPKAPADSTRADAPGAARAAGAGAEAAAAAAAAAATAATAATAVAVAEPDKPEPKKVFPPLPGCNEGAPWAALWDQWTPWQGARMGKPRIMCNVYTNAGDGSIYKGQGESKPRLPFHRGQWGTWGPSCDKFIFWTDKPLASGLPHRLVQPVLGKEGYYNMWQKVRAIWMRVHKEFGDDYDWFSMGGDDVFMVVENLRKYLLSPEIAEPNARGEGLYLGRRMQLDAGRIFNTGGANYIINKVALQQLIKFMPDQRCRPDEHTHQEDVKVSCILKLAGIEARATVATDGHRFTPLSPEANFVYKIGSWGPMGWYDLYQIPLYESKAAYEEKFPCCGVKCCSKYMVSMHYCDYGLMQTIWNYLHYCRGDGPRVDVCAGGACAV